MKETRNRIRNTTNRIYAIFVASPAIPPNPRRAAIIAMIKNVTAQLSMSFLLLLINLRYR
jgi:hypothetical protein